MCYTIPLIAAAAHYGLRKKVQGWKESKHHLWLNLLLAGGAVFGVVDHLWNGELLLVSENLLWDLLLGVTITLTIFVVWFGIAAVDRAAARKARS